MLKIYLLDGTKPAPICSNIKGNHTKVWYTLTLLNGDTPNILEGFLLSL